MSNDMSFLDDGGDIKIVPPVSQATPKPMEKISYNTKVAHIEQDFSVPLETPYVQRAIALAKSIGYSIALNLKTALEQRASGMRSVTYREADIMLRSGVNAENHEFLLASLHKFDGYLTEEDSSFSIGIFELRSRYNKGKKWLRTEIPGRTEDQYRKGVLRLHEIEQELENTHLSIHEEEKLNGFHQEFLKPEHMTWSQFELAMRRRYRTLSDRNLSSGNNQ